MSYSCPLCHAPLSRGDNHYSCPQRHQFDLAKEGYVNLLTTSRKGDSVGDNKDMARSRRDFLNKGCYEPLAKAVTQALGEYSHDGDTVLDICCGEGYYTAYAAERLERSFYGFDLGKNMVRLAAKPHNDTAIDQTGVQQQGGGDIGQAGNGHDV